MDVQTRLEQLEKENAVLRAEARDTNAARDFYLKVFEDFPALIWRAGLDMKCDYFNRTWLAFTGRTQEQERGDGWTEGVHPADLDACFQTYVGHFREQKPFAMFYRLRNRFGEYRWIKDLGQPFYSLENEFLGYIGSCYDVTEERENALKLEELNRSKDRFFSLVAHDLRGPMGAIRNLTEILDESIRTTELEEEKVLMHQLSQAAGQVCGLLGDLLAWSQSQLKGGVWNPEPLHLGTLVREAAAPLRDSLGQKQIYLTIADAGPLEVFADRNMVKTIFRNLLGNAVKFTPPGGAIAVTAGEKDGFALVTVRDTGTGIPDELLGQLFTLGAQTTRPGTAGETGTGLGLVLCREFAERNRGKLWVESTEGRGTAVTVMLPLQSDGTPVNACP